MHKRVKYKTLAQLCRFATVSQALAILENLGNQHGEFRVFAVHLRNTGYNETMQAMQWQRAENNMAKDIETTTTSSTCHLLELDRVEKNTVSCEDDRSAWHVDTVGERVG